MNAPNPLRFGLIVLSFMLFAAGVCFADQVDQERLNALDQALAGLGRAQDHPPQADQPVSAAQVCWTPHGEFSAAGIATTVPYGPRGLAAQCDIASSGGGPWSAAWSYNNSAQPLSAGDCPLAEGSTTIANGLLKAEGPLLPGVYNVTFTDRGRTIARGKITIAAPPDLAGRDVKAVYLEALKSLDSAIKDVDAGRAQPAARAASASLPLFGTVMMAQPQDQDAVAVYELAQAIVAIGKMEELSTRNVPDQVLDWARRAHAHTSLAAEFAVDGQLKTKARQYTKTLEDALPKMAQAAARAH